jgi:GNAT superfamily N-acetyltransferase
VPDPELAAIGEPARLDLWVERTAASTEVSTFVALLDGEVIGFAAYGAERSDLAAAEDGRGEVFALYVHPDDWGTGGGHALMPSARAALRARIRRCEHLGARGRRPRHRVLPAPGIRADR